MSDDTLTMEGVEAIDLTEAATATAPDKKEATKSEEPAKPADGDDDSTSFVGAFAKAMEGEDLAGEESATEDTKESRSSSDFKKIKTDRDSARQELEELRTKLSDLENSDVDKVMGELKSERDDLSARLKMAAIERHPKFQAEFQAKITKSKTQAARIVGDIWAERISELLDMPDNDSRVEGIEEIMMELSTSKQAQLGSVLASVDEVRIEKELALENAEETYNNIVREQQAEQDASMLQTNKLFDEIAEEAKGLEVFSDRSDDNEWNAEVKNRVDMARGIFAGENDPKELARASLWAAAAPKYRELLVAQIELNRRLRQQIGTGVTPAMGGNGDGAGAAKPKSFVEAYSDAMNS